MTGRRPLAAPALLFALGVATGAAGLPFPRPALPVLALALSPPLSPLAFGAAGWLCASARRTLPAAAEADAALEGTVVSAASTLDGRSRFLLRDGDGMVVDASVEATAWPLALGDRVRFRARLRPLAAGPGNPGGRDPAAPLRASGVALEARAIGPAVRVAPPSPLAWLERGRQRFAEAASRALPAREAGVVRAIGAGDRGGLDGPTRDAFARSGLAHLLAVSGLHLVVVAFGLERLLRALLLRVDAIAARIDPRRLAAALALPASVLYALATGAGVPVLRAALAAAVAFSGALLDREPDALNTLALATLLLLAQDPGALLDPSLQLSFAAVLGIGLWATPLRRALPISAARPGSWRARLVEPVLAGGCTTVAASLATAPVLALHFRQLPVLGVLANVPGVPIGSLLTLATAVAALASAASPVVGGWLLLPARPLAAALIWLADASSAPGWAALPIASPGPLAAAAALAAAVLATRVRRGRPALAALAVLLLLVPGPARQAAARARGLLEVTFVSVGQGDCALLRLPDGAAVLVDGGGAPGGAVDPGARDVVPLLRDLGIRRLAAVFVSHPHPDHVLGLAAIAAAVPIERTFTNGDPGTGDAARVLAALPAPQPVVAGAVWERAGVRFEVVEAGPEDGWGANDGSLVLRVVHGRVAFLFPGDVEAAGEARAVAAGGLSADVVKIPHHGSRTSSGPAFVAATGARLAVGCLGRDNRFGFPHPEVVARWRAAGAEVVRTDEGAVRLVSDGRAVRRFPAGDALDALATWFERP